MTDKNRIFDETKLETICKGASIELEGFWHERLRDFIKISILSYAKSEKLKLLKSLNDLENPFPESIFVEPTHREYKKFNAYLKKGGFIPDKYNGAMGRIVWNSLMNRIKSALKKEIENEETEKV